MQITLNKEQRQCIIDMIYPIFYKQAENINNNNFIEPLEEIGSTGARVFIKVALDVFKLAEIIGKSKISLEEYIDFFEVGKFYTYENYVITRQNTKNIFVPKDFESAVVSEDNTGSVIITFKTA